MSCFCCCREKKGLDAESGALLKPVVKDNALTRLTSELTGRDVEVDFYLQGKLVLRGNNTFKLKADSAETAKQNNFITLFTIKVFKENTFTGLTGNPSITFEEDEDKFHFLGDLTYHNSKNRDQEGKFNLNFFTYVPTKAAIAAGTTHTFTFLPDTEVVRNSNIFQSLQADTLRLTVHELEEILI